MTRRTPIPCPVCGRLFRPNYRQIAACSTTCMEARRKAEGVTVHGVLKQPTWGKA